MNPADIARLYPTALALGAATVMIAQQVAGKAARDALFLSHFDVVNLPKAVIAGALVSLLAVLVMSRLLTRVGPARAVPAAFAVSAVLFLAERLILDRAPGATAILLYLHMSGFGVIVISGFWSLINERFDPHSAKRRIARIAAGAALGGVLGGLLAQVVAEQLGFSAMLVLLALLNGVCAVVLRPLGRAGPAELETGGEPMRSGVVLIARTPYLRYMAGLLTLMAMSAALLDYAFKAQAAAHFASREDLVAFFATFYAVAGVTGFLVQSMLGPRLLERFGIGPALAALPIVIVLGGVAASFVVTLASTALLRGSHAVLGNSLFRSSFELLYAPLPAHAKRPTKTIVDVAADRLGDILGGGLVLMLLAVAPRLPPAVLVLLAGIAAAAALAVVKRLTRGYVEQLAGTLRSGAVSLAEDDVLDATTRRILAETSAEGERQDVLERIEELERERTQTRRELAQSTPDRSIDEPDVGRRARDTHVDGTEHHARLARAPADLCSGDVHRVRRALRGDFMDLRLVPHLISLLDHPEHAADARMELRWLVPRVIGQLTDALLDADQSLAVRQRIPAVMEICHNPRAVHGLLEGIADGEFNVRYASARALARMRSRDPLLTLPTSSVYAAVSAEVNVDRTTWSTRSLGDDGDAGFGPTVHADAGEGASLSLDHVFTLLGLVLDRDALQLALQALSSDNRNLRGTALEYLDNVLPEDLRRRLWRHLGIAAPRPAHGGAAHQPRSTGGIK